MRKSLFIILVLVLISIVSFAQNNNEQDTIKEHTNLYTSMSFGQDYFSNNFYTNTFGVDYAKQIDSKTTIYLGANVFNISMVGDPIDLAPKRKLSGSMYMGIDYQVNNKLALGGSIFYNGFYNAIGTTFDMKYQFSEDSFFELSATFIKQLNNFAGNHQPVPYGYYQVFDPFIFGY